MMSISVRVCDVITCCRCEVQACQFNSGFILHSFSQFLSKMTQLRFYLTDELEIVISSHNRKQNACFDLKSSQVIIRCWLWMLVRNMLVRLAVFLIKMIYLWPLALTSPKNVNNIQVRSSTSHQHDL